MSEESASAKVDDLENRLARVRALLPGIDELIEFEREGDRDYIALMQVRDHLRRALADCTCGTAWNGHPNPHAITCPRFAR